MTGSDIHLFSIDDKTFGVHIDDQRSCVRGVSRCNGKSAPDYGLKALFAIKCGEKTYVGFDKYFFAPINPDTNEPISFECRDSPIGVRPKWKILGFFKELFNELPLKCMCHIQLYTQL